VTFNDICIHSCLVPVCLQNDDDGGGGGGGDDKNNNCFMTILQVRLC